MRQELHMSIPDLERLISSLTRGFARSWSVEEADAKQQAWIAVLRSAPRFDPAKGHAGAYYQCAIARALRRLFARTSSAVTGNTHRPTAETVSAVSTVGYHEADSDLPEGARDRAVVAAVAAAVAAATPEDLVAAAEWRAAVKDRVGRIESRGASPRSTAAFRKRASRDPVLRALFADVS